MESPCRIFEFSQEYNASQSDESRSRIRHSHGKSLKPFTGGIFAESFAVANDARRVLVVERNQRSFCVLFAFQVTCPGTFLRDYGYVYLKVNCMGLEVNTKSVAPTFPLFFHERLRFERVSYIQSNLTPVISSRMFHI